MHFHGRPASTIHHTSEESLSSFLIGWERTPGRQDIEFSSLEPSNEKDPIL